MSFTEYSNTWPREDATASMGMGWPMVIPNGKSAKCNHDANAMPIIQSNAMPNFIFSLFQFAVRSESQTTTNITLQVQQCYIH